MDDREVMGTAEAAKASLIDLTRAWRTSRQPIMDTPAGHKARNAVDQELRFRICNAALLWLWHEENPVPQSPQATETPPHG